MLRWILGAREAQGSVQKSPVLCIGEEQPKNWFTELQVLKGHFDIVRFLVQIDDFRSTVGGKGQKILSRLLSKSENVVWMVEGQRAREAGKPQDRCFVKMSSGGDGHTGNESSHRRRITCVCLAACTMRPARCTGACFVTYGSHLRETTHLVFSRCASAGDDGLVLVWNVETGERLQELRGHSQQITAITTFTCSNGPTSHTSLITASSDRSLSLWDPDTGNRVQTISDLQSSVKCLLVLERLCVWVSGGEELCVWNEDFQLQCQRQNQSDTGITALIELPKNCIAAAVDKEIVIYRLTVSTDSSMSLAEIRRLSDHQDRIRALINVGDGLFASGSHAGELILWDAIDWNILGYEHILWEESQACSQAEIRLAAPKPSEMSIQHLTTNGRHILAAVGSGLYVYCIQTKTVVAYRKVAHDSNVLHTMLLSDSELMSCSEDGSVRMWEIQDLPLPGEPASPGFFGMWTFGRSNKQTGPPSKKVPDVPHIRTLELTGDLIGHSGAVQMFASFGENGLLTCSTDHLLILWKNGERQAHLRSLALFQKLEENGGL